MKLQRTETNMSALILSVPHIHFPYKDLENLLHALDYSHHAWLCGPHITAHLPDQAQTDGFRKMHVLPTLKLGRAKHWLENHSRSMQQSGQVPLHSEPVQTAKVPHLQVP